MEGWGWPPDVEELGHDALVAGSRRWLSVAQFPEKLALTFGGWFGPVDVVWTVRVHEPLLVVVMVS